MPVLAGIALALALRIPWMHAALGRDEGGVLMVARAWRPGHPFAYGPYFLDRPPVLVALYRLAGTAGGVRFLGGAAAAALVAMVTVVAAQLGGRRGAWVAAVPAAALASSFTLDSVFTPAELLAAVPAVASVGLLIEGLRAGRIGALAGAGAAAVLALLVKQSFFDATAVGLAGVVVAAATGPRGRRLRPVLAYLAGASAIVATVAAWDALAGLNDDRPYSLLYAIVGFRIDAVATLSHRAGTAIGHLGQPVLQSGLAVLLPVSLLGIARVREAPGIRIALVLWPLAAAIGVLGGGSYWHHYLIELIGPVCAGLALLSVRWRVPSPAIAFACAGAAGTFTLSAAASGIPARYELRSDAIARFVRDSARPGDSVYALYAAANTVAATGLPSPFPYEWSLMMRAAPRAQATLRALLASAQRPTWIMQWQRTTRWGLDRDGRTHALLRANYRLVGRICGKPIWLARSAGRRRLAPDPCGLTDVREG